MKYGEFEDALLVAIVAVADQHPKGQVDVFAATAGIDPAIGQQWAYDAVRTYENAGYVHNVIRGISPPRLWLMVTGSGRRAAERIAEKAA